MINLISQSNLIEINKLRGVRTLNMGSETETSQNSFGFGIYEIEFRKYIYFSDSRIPTRNRNIPEIYY